MIPEKFLCPECKAAPDGTAETIPGVALVNFDENGVPYYGGETRVLWDGQTSDRNEAGHILFHCGACFHEYPVDGIERIS